MQWENKTIIVDQSNLRIDKYLVKCLCISRTKVQQLFNETNVYLNNQLVDKLSTLVNINDVIEIKVNEVDKQQVNLSKLIIPYEYDLKILYEDQYFWIVYKPSGMLSHPTSFNETNSLINAMKYNFNQYDKFYLIHRLDKSTSGLIMIAKDETYQLKMQQLFNENKVIKKYYAIVRNHFKDKHLMIDVPICHSYQKHLYYQANEGKNCKDARTEVFLVANLNDNNALVDVLLHTGRTHQIRVHLKYINHSILNDPLYGDKLKNDNYEQYLMNYYLAFNHPYTNQFVELKIKMDDEFINKLKQLGFNYEQ